jgi:hypothetical protein
LCVFVPVFDLVEFVCGDGCGFPVRFRVGDKFAEVFFGVSDTTEEIDARWGGVETGAGEGAGDVVVIAREVDWLLDEGRQDVGERGVAADPVGRWSTG